MPMLWYFTLYHRLQKQSNKLAFFLSNGQKAAIKQGKRSIKEARQCIFTQEEVCAQEAVYWLTNMHLKESSRKVVCTDRLLQSESEFTPQCSEAASGL